MNESFSCSSIAKNYRSKCALKDFTLELVKGEAVGLLGVNGAGKSTALKSLLGLVKPSKGVVSYPANAALAFMPEVAQMPQSVSPYAFVSLALKLQKKPCAWANETLQALGLSAKKIHQPIRQLSKGLKQRTALAYTLAPKPEWIVLDEPMSGLDAIGRVAVLNLLKKQKTEGAGILICSHIVPDLVRLSDRVLLMSEGHVREEVVLSSHDMDEVTALEAKLRHWSEQ